MSQKQGIIEPSSKCLTATSIRQKSDVNDETKVSKDGRTVVAMATIIKTETKVTEITTTSEVVDLTGTNALEVAKKLADARELKKLADELEAEAKAEAEALMGNAKFGVVDGNKVFQRMNGKSTGIDRDKLKELSAAIFDKVYWEKATHWFKVLG